MESIKLEIEGNFRDYFDKYWLETNGQGGFISSTVVNIPVSRYQGIYAITYKHPNKKFLIINHLIEEFIVDDKKIELTPLLAKDSDFTFSDFKLTFKQGFNPSFLYKGKNFSLLKEIIMFHNSKNVIIKYTLLDSKFDKIKLIQKPLFSIRNIHNINENIRKMKTKKGITEKRVEFFLTNRLDSMFIYFSRGNFVEDQKTVDIFYPKDEIRGLKSNEQLVSPGYFNVSLKKGEPHFFVLSMSDELKSDFHLIFEQEINRRKSLIKHNFNVRNEGFKNSLKHLIIASDKFIIKREIGLANIISGYPFYGEVGRDALMSMTGFCLSLKRYNLSKKILMMYSKYCHEGFIPNGFTAFKEQFDYLSADTSFWFIMSIYKYIQYTGDWEFVQEDLWKPITEIIINFQHVNNELIKIGPDGLIYSTDKAEPMTWMNLKVDNISVTPRDGAAVEVNALWYNALKIVELISASIGDIKINQICESLAEKVKKSFQEKFYNDKKGYLNDIVTENSFDDTLRPNQIIALALPFKIMPVKLSRKIITSIEKELLTDFGLRSLSPGNKKYRSKFTGEKKHRYQAYHQGAVWPFFLGFYIEAKLDTGDRKSVLNWAEKFLLKFLNIHLSQGCIGSISEIFDGMEPFTPRGCFAHSAGTAEILRLLCESIRDDPL